MDRVIDRGKGWREEITPFLENLEAIVFNPILKPTDIGLEDSHTHAHKLKLKKQKRRPTSVHETPKREPEHRYRRWNPNTGPKRKPGSRACISIRKAQAGHGQ